MKSKLFALATVLAGTAPALADGGGVEIKTDWVASLQTTFTGLVDTLIPVVLAIVGGFLAFWAIRFVVRLVKRMSSSAS